MKRYKIKTTYFVGNSQQYHTSENRGKSTVVIWHYMLKQCFLFVCAHCRNKARFPSTRSLKKNPWKKNKTNKNDSLFTKGKTYWDKNTENTFFVLKMVGSLLEHLAVTNTDGCTESQSLLKAYVTLRSSCSLSLAFLTILSSNLSSLKLIS